MEERFWKKVEKGNGCWNWTASKFKNGYGQFRVIGNADAGAHRWSWRIAFGEIPGGKWVLHKCDNPSCVRPDHLFIGTRQDNSDDCVAKGRQPRGEAHCRSKISEVQVLEIYQRCLNHENQKDIGKDYGVSQTTIGDICRADGWKHLGIKPIPSQHGKSRGEKRPDAKLTSELIPKIMARSKAGESLRSIGRSLGVTGVLIGLVVRRKIWKHILVS